MVPWIEPHEPLPPTSLALGPDSDAPGLLAAGAPVTLARLEEAYRRGIFPWYSGGQPPLWWSPDPRMVLPVSEFRLAHSLRKTLRRFLRTPGCEVRFDHDFPGVMRACGDPSRPYGWISSAFVAAYSELHRLGWAHSVEALDDGGRLVGGVYGVRIGRLFAAESMFHHATDAGKVALAALIARLAAEGASLFDVQWVTPHLATLGAIAVSRDEYLRRLADAVRT